MNELDGSEWREGGRGKKGGDQVKVVHSSFGRSVGH